MKKLITLLIIAFALQSCENKTHKTEKAEPQKKVEVSESKNKEKTGNEAFIKIPEDFTELTESPSNGRKMDRLSFYFDDDSLKDIATVVENKSEFSKYKLLIYLTNLKKQYEIDLYSTNDFSIYPVQLEISKNTLQFGYFEDGTSAFGRFIKLRYNPDVKKVQVIGYDSGYRASPSEHIDKSYNLLTGKYIVKRTNYDESDEGKVVEFSGKNDYFKNKVFIENLDVDMLMNLDDVGSKYE